MGERDKKNNTIAVVGYREAVIPFLAIGADVFITESIEEARTAIDNYAKEGCPVIFVPDDLLKEMPDIYERYSTLAKPSITSIPGKDGTITFTQDKINLLIKKAIGIDLVAIGGE
jgi:vacuolar-type H+-ATPase subunit F/Vma7